MVSPITGMITIMMTAPSVMNVAVLARCGMRRINARCMGANSIARMTAHISAL